MTKVRSIILVPVAAASLATIAVACGSYSTSDGPSGLAGTGGSPDNSGGSGAVTDPGAGLPGISGTEASGGSTPTPSGGSGAEVSIGGMNEGVAGTMSAGGASSGGMAAGGMATGGTSMGGAHSGGMVGAGGGAAGGPPTATVALPCDVLTNGGNKCVSAHSTVRVIVPGYTGPLYQVCKGQATPGPSSCKGTTQNINAVAGYADAAAQDTFCAGTTCTITKIYDQSGQMNDLEPAPKGGAKNTPDNPATANALKISINGHPAYGILIKPGIGYRTGCTQCNVKQGNGMVKGDAPESMYWVTSSRDLIDGCCFDYGNAETTSNDDGNGTMETLYFGGGVVWGTGFGGKPGPWMMADLENGLYAGWENNQDKNISTNKKINFDFVTGVLLGDTGDKNNSKGRFAIYGGDATAGTLQTMYDGIRPVKPGYVGMKKQGSIILGIGGDNSGQAGGRFYEGAISTGPVVSKATVDALQAAVVAAKYGK